MNINKIYNEDCIETMKKMPDNFVDLIITSPPYDNLRTYDGFEFDFKSIAKETYRVIKDGGVIVWIVADETKNFCESLTSFKQAIFFVDECGFNLLDTMIWEKPNYAPGYPKLRRYDNNFEYMFIFTKGKPKTYNLIKDKPKKQSSLKRGQYETSYIKQDGTRTRKLIDNSNQFCKRTNIWNIPNGNVRGLNHPAVFPEQLVNDHIISWSNENDLIYDPFMGSGTTAKMAIVNNRNYIGSEISKKYCDIIYSRLEQFGELL